jgi:hypothetical protein
MRESKRDCKRDSEIHQNCVENESLVVSRTHPLYFYKKQFNQLQSTTINTTQITYRHYQYQTELCVP